MDDVRDDQEIAGKPHSHDRVEFKFEALAIGCCGVAADLGPTKPLLQPGSGSAAQCRLLVGAPDCRKSRQDGSALLRDEGAAAGDNEGVVAGFRQIGEDRPHRLRRPKVMIWGQPLAFLVGDNCCFSDTKQCVVRFVKIAIGKIGVVGRDERQVVTISQLDQTRLGSCLFGRTVAHQLDVQPVRKHAREVDQGSFGGLGLALREKPPDRTAWPSGQAKEPLARLSKIASDDRRLGRHLAREIGPADEIEQVAVARLALRQKHDPIRFASTPIRPAPISAAIAHQGDLATNDRLNTGGGAGCCDFERAEQIAGVGDRHCRHALGLAQINQLIDPDRPRRPWRFRRGYAVTTGGACVPPGRLSVIQESISSHQSYSHPSWVS